MTDTTVKKQSKPWEFKKGESGNPAGRPKGSKQLLSEDFIAALAADFERYGLYPIARTRRDNPAAYLKVIASVLPKDINVKPVHPLAQMSIKEIHAELAEIRQLTGLLTAERESLVGRPEKGNGKTKIH